MVFLSASSDVVGCVFTILDRVHLEKLAGKTVPTQWLRANNTIAMVKSRNVATTGVFLSMKGLERFSLNYWIPNSAYTLPIRFSSKHPVNSGQKEERHILYLYADRYLRKDVRNESQPVRVNFKKAFDTVNMHKLFVVQERFECPNVFSSH